MFRFFSRWFDKKKPRKPESRDQPAAPAHPGAPQPGPASGKASAPAKAPAPARDGESRETARAGAAAGLAPLLLLPVRERRSRRARRVRRAGRRVRRLKPRTPLQRPEGNKRYSQAEVQAVGLAPAALRGRCALDRRRRSAHQRNCEQLQAALAAAAGASSARDQTPGT